MFRFTIFGVPVEIQPWFWVTTAFLGGAMQADTQEGMLRMLVFMVVALLSILAHELGHALVGRKFGGGEVFIVLYAMGGLAYNRGARFTRWQRALMILAGPGAGFLIAAITIAILCLIWTPAGGISITTVLLFNHSFIRPPRDVIHYLLSQETSIWVIYDFLFINFWWGVMNLLPILPLDGGRFAELFLRPTSRAHYLGIVVGTAVAVYAISIKEFYMAAFFGWLAWQNYTHRRVAL